MRSRRSSYLIGFVLAAASAPVVNAQTSVTGSLMALKSNGSSTLPGNGYIGTYLVVPAGGATVNFTLNATGQAGAPSHLNVAVADSKFGFSVNSSSPTNYISPNLTLPAGTYFVRNERDYSGNVGLTGSFTVNSLAVNTVTGSVATFSNSGTDANALAAANTYINNFRKGPGTIALTGPANIKLLAGTPVNVDMSRNAFNFGGTVSGTGPSTGDSKNMLNANPAPGTEANQFQQFINQYFNTIVPSNAGKWAYNEGTQNNVTMTLVDQQLNYAQSHNMRARVHNLIWGSGSLSGNQQPTWVNTLIGSAAGGNVTSKTNLRNAIGSRINYYIGTTGNRAQKFIEVDGLNEAWHNPSYWNVYNPATGSGSFNLASVYNDMVAAATAAGNPNLRVMLNEFNVLQFSPASINLTTGVQSGSDLYANWYRNQNEAVRNAGGAISGIGIQEYTNLTATGSNAHSAATIEKGLQNLSVEGVPLSMTEFGLGSGTSASDRDTLGPAAMDSAMRMFYGNPLATTFMIWGWWDTSGNTPPAQMIVTTPGAGSYALTTFGQKWVDLMNEFSTHTTPTVDASGNITFTGFYGDYNIGNQSGFQNLTLAKGTTNYALNLAAPPTWSLWNVSNSGNWSTAGNWSTGGVASAAGQTAYIGSAVAPRTVTVDSARTVGMLAFNSLNSYTLGGTGTITFAGFNVAGGNVAAVHVTAGNHAIGAPVILSDDTTVTVGPVISTLTMSNLRASAGALIKNGLGNLALNKADVSALRINGGAVSILAGRDPFRTSHVTSLSISGGAALDLNDQDMAINYTGGSPLATIKSLIISGYNGGDWSGDGIRSTSAAASPPGAPTALGYGEIGGSTALIRYTYAGDATLDGAVDTTDFNILASNFGANTNVVWDQADFNYDGSIDSLDFTAMAANFGKSLPGASASFGALIPEPGTSGLIVMIASIGMVRRSRRRAH
jgi:GH35 family endo-1,4-beta-xylanase